MKKILGLAAGMMLTIATFAQGSVTFLDANATYDKTKVTSFNFEFSPEFTVDQINKAAEFYTSYFTVTPKWHVVLLHVSLLLGSSKKS
ncbi:MAG: hypothetical protein IPG07_08940 [Crocinitomicaceae bacterium]|nr:hypothetical protein [Crocinitomicaceae bacterium]